MRILLALLATPLLLAQAHYEGGLLVETVQIPSGRVYDFDGVPTLAFTPAKGRTRHLELPPELDGRLGAGLHLAHHQGTTYALGRFHAPLPALPPGRRIDQEVGKGQPLHLFVRRPGQAWRETARLSWQDAQGLDTFLPLGNGSFLLGKRELFWEGRSLGPFALFRVDAGGWLRLERLADLGLGGPLYRKGPDGTPRVAEAHAELDGGYRNWSAQRLPAGILLLHRASGRWVLLDAWDGHTRKAGRLWAPGEAETACIAPRPDGRLLVAAFPGSRKAALQAWPEGDFHAHLKGGVYPSRPGDALLIRRCEALDTLDYRARPALRWLALDSDTGHAMELAPPKDFPPPMNRMEVFGFRMVVQPDGRLRLRENLGLKRFMEIPARRWRQALRLPFPLPEWMVR